MKIEICEQMVQSWLVNCKKCQIAQTNWSISPLKDMDAYKTDIETYIDYFVNVLKSGVAKGEIDSDVANVTKEEAIESFDMSSENGEDISFVRFCEMLVSTQKKGKQKEQGIDFSAIERRVMLMTVDRNWIDHIDAMDQLRKGISLRAYGQVDPIISYKQEGFDMFDEMIERIQRSIISVLLKVKVETRPAPAPMQAPVAPAAPAPAQAQPEQPAQPVRQFRRQMPSPLSSMSSFKERVAAAEEAMKNGENNSNENK